jgi:hypothetical protein
MSEKVNAPGKGLLKVSSIIGVIFEAIALFTMAITLMGIETIVAAMPVPIPVWQYVCYCIYGLIYACFSAYIYIIGIVHCDKLEKAGLMKVYGIILIVLVPVSIGVGLALKITGLSGLALAPLGLIIPILYVVGASKNMSVVAN